MARLLIAGGHRLEGSVSILGSKNSALPIVTAAALAAEGESVLDNVPRSTDIDHLCEILRHLGAEVEVAGARSLRIRGRNLGHHVAPYQLARRLRGSTYVVGLLLARLGQAEVAFPGGCNIGTRPVDYHVKGFQALGAEVTVERGSIVGNTNGQASGRLQGTRLFIDRSSFGTTINMMIAATLAKGTTVLENAAQEPEVVDLANFLNRMGARVRGAGTNTIRIDGVERLTGARHEVIPDRLEAGTYLLAGAISGGRVRVEDCISEHLHTVLVKLQEAGCEIDDMADTIELRAPRRLRAVDIVTQPHPGFPTDLQSPFCAVMTVSDGISVLQETIFESRFGYAAELQRMGANIKVERDTAIVRGVDKLYGAPVQAQDIRGGVALVLAGLAAEGETEVSGMNFIDRGYEKLEERLQSLGASVQRLPGTANGNGAVAADMAEATAAASIAEDDGGSAD